MRFAGALPQAHSSDSGKPFCPCAVWGLSKAFSMRWRQEYRGSSLASSLMGLTAYAVCTAHYVICVSR